MNQLLNPPYAGDLYNLISLYIKDSDMHYWNTMNDLIVEILKPNKDETVPVKVWKYFNDLRKLIDSRFST